MVSWNSKLHETLQSATRAGLAEYYKVGFEQARIISASRLPFLLMEALSWRTKHWI